MDNIESTIVDLSFLGRLYHTHFGFRNNQWEFPGYTSLAVQFNDQNKKLFINAFKYDIDIYDEIDDNVYNENNRRKLIESFDDLIDDDFYVITYDTVYIERKAQIALPYSKVIIKYEKDDWRAKPKEWYNRPSKRFVHTKRSTWDQEDVLPYLNTRQNITVVKPFMEVEIESNGIFLTYDDILFATRALAADETRTYNAFKVLSEKNNILTLTVDMDNSSS
jgi:hypothetical protein